VQPRGRFYYDCLIELGPHVVGWSSDRCPGVVHIAAVEVRGLIVPLDPELPRPSSSTAA